MNVDLDSFNAGGFKYSAEKANLFRIPVGVAVNGRFKASCDAEAKPFLDLTVNPTMGDKKVTNKVALLGTSASVSIDAQIANAAMFNARLGLEANRGAHSLGLNYRVGAGNRGRVDQALQAKYRFSFSSTHRRSHPIKVAVRDSLKITNRNKKMRCLLTPHFINGRLFQLAITAFLVIAYSLRFSYLP